MGLFKTNLTLLVLALVTSLGCAPPDPGQGTIRFQVDSDCPTCVCEDYCLDQIDVQLWREGDLLPTATHTGSCGSEILFTDLLAGSAFTLHVFLSRDGAPVLTGISDTAVVLKDNTQDVTVIMELSDESAKPILEQLLTDPVVLLENDGSSVRAQFSDLGTGTGQPSLMLSATPLETTSVDELTITSEITSALVQDIPGSLPEIQGSVCSIGSPPLPLRILKETPELLSRDALVCANDPLVVANSFGDASDAEGLTGFLIGCPSTTGWELWRFSDSSCLAFDQVTLPDEPVQVSANSAGERACLLSSDLERVHHLDFTTSEVLSYSLSTGVQARAVTADDDSCFAITAQAASPDDRQVIELDAEGEHLISELDNGHHEEILSKNGGLWILTLDSPVSGQYFAVHFDRSSKIVTQIPIESCSNAHALRISEDGNRFAVACDEPASVYVFDQDQQQALTWNLLTPDENVQDLLWDHGGDVLFARTKDHVHIGHLDDSGEDGLVEHLTSWSLTSGPGANFFFTFAGDDRIFLEGESGGSFRTLRSYVGVPQCESQ